jgi:hypothetical protein
VYKLYCFKIIVSRPRAKRNDPTYRFSVTTKTRQPKPIKKPERKDFTIKTLRSDLNILSSKLMLGVEVCLSQKRRIIAYLKRLHDTR